MYMKNMLLIGTSIIILVIIAGVFMNNSLTGFIIVGGGGAQSIGEQATGNPKYGTVYGNVIWEIKEGDNIISSEIPDQTIDVYFIPTNKTINWNVSVTCDTEIKGALKKIDADGAGARCIENEYASQTTYECTAQDANAQTIKIYKSTTDMNEENIGCFATKIKPGEYDIYM
jgi:hypothetical protein